MFFVIQYNWTGDGIENKRSVGVFRSYSEAKNFSQFVLPYDENRNTVAILYFEDGPVTYSYPKKVYEWNEYYGVYCPLRSDDIRWKATATY